MLSTQQSAIVNAIAKAVQSIQFFALAIVARAGTGKTFTILEACKKIPKNMTAIFLAFNKSIQTELAAKLAGMGANHVEALTFHALGLRIWAKHTGINFFGKFAKGKITEYKLSDILKTMIDDGTMDQEDRKLYGMGVMQLVHHAKLCGLVPQGVKAVNQLVADTDNAWQYMIDRFEIEFSSDCDMGQILRYARILLTRSINQKDRLDYDDMLFMPVIMGAKFPTYNVIFVDEAQDMNGTRREMVKMLSNKESKLIIVGDPCQAIYGFTGADSDSMDQFIATFSADTLPLTVSRRCGKNIISAAQSIVPDIEALDNAPAGSVQSLSNWSVDMFKSTDGIICRNTAPVVALAFKIIRTGTRCRVLGREIGTGLISLIRQAVGKGKEVETMTIKSLSDRLADWGEIEIGKLKEKGQDRKAEALSDKIETVNVFISQLSDTQKVADLISKIDSFFSDQTNGCITLCTVHKSKGLEWERVFILDPHLMPSKHAKQDWQLEQERNLQYVAITRAKSELCYITSEKDR